MAGWRSAEDEALVSVAGDLVAFLAVGAYSAGVGHEDSEFAGDVGAEVPGVGEDEEGGVGDLVDVGDPGLPRPGDLLPPSPRLVRSSR